MKFKKSKITEKELRELDIYLDKHIEKRELTKEQWRNMQAARERGLKKLMFSMGITGKFVYYSTAFKKKLISIIRNIIMRISLAMEKNEERV